MIILLASTNQDTFAWNSFDSTIGEFLGYSDQVHEDITEIAFNMVLKEDTNHSGTLSKLPKDDTLRMLRQGAFWNDAATESTASFVLSHMSRNNIVPYHNSEYNNVFDICNHINENMNLLAFLSRHSVIIQFSHNGNANFLHSMLNQNPDRSFCSQLETKQFILDWLEFSYKYSSNEELTSEQKMLIVFIDPDQEIDYQTLTLPDSKIRALGMACHTIQDSYNPAHTSRSCYDNKIKGFLNCDEQSYHSKFDAISPIDSSIRNQLLDSSSLSYYDMDLKLDSLKTPGLSDSIRQTYEFLRKFNYEDSWSDIYNWIENDVFDTNFDPAGNTKIISGGRLIQKIKIKDYWDNNIKAALISKNLMTHQDLERIETALDEYYKFKDEEMDAFYPLCDSSFILTEIQENSLYQVQTIIDTIFQNTPIGFIDQFTDDERFIFNSFIKQCDELIQDYCMDLGPEYDSLAEDYSYKINSMLEII